MFNEKYTIFERVFFRFCKKKFSLPKELYEEYSPELDCNHETIDGFVLIPAGFDNEERKNRFGVDNGLLTKNLLSGFRTGKTALRKYIIATYSRNDAVSRTSEYFSVMVERVIDNDDRTDLINALIRELEIEEIVSNTIIETSDNTYFYSLLAKLFVYAITENESIFDKDSLKIKPTRNMAAIIEELNAGGISEIVLGTLDLIYNAQWIRVTNDTPVEFRYTTSNLKKERITFNDVVTDFMCDAGIRNYNDYLPENIIRFDDNRFDSLSALSDIVFDVIRVDKLPEFDIPFYFQDDGDLDDNTQETKWKDDKATNNDGRSSSRRDDNGITSCYSLIHEYKRIDRHSLNHIDREILESIIASAATIRNGKRPLFGNVSVPGKYSINIDFEFSDKPDDSCYVFDISFENNKAFSDDDIFAFSCALLRYLDDLDDEHRKRASKLLKHYFEKRNSYLTKKYGRDEAMRMVLDLWRYRFYGCFSDINIDIPTMKKINKNEIKHCDISSLMTSFLVDNTILNKKDSSI